MKRLFAVVVALGLLTGFAAAQSTTQAWEAYAGYSFVRQFDQCCVNLNGFNAGLQQNLNPWFGGVVDFGASFYTTNGVRTSCCT